MEKTSWVCTLGTQVCLCLALYGALNIGMPQRSIYSIAIRGGGRPLDLYFISVRGGSRSLQQQTHLLKQMEKVARIYGAKFVVNISELGEDDPLMQNGTLHFPSLKVPWYSTCTSKGKGYFLKQIATPSGQILDIIVLETSSLQDHLRMGRPSIPKSNQLQWLTRVLGVTDSNWRIVVGFHSPEICEEHKEQMETNDVYEPLHHIFLRFGVNAYLSKQGCSSHYTRKGSIAYITNPDPTDRPINGAPSVNGSSTFAKCMHDGFLLHRVSPLEIASYFINSASEVVYRSTIHQGGKEIM